MNNSDLDYCGKDLRKQILSKEQDYSGVHFRGSIGIGVDFSGLNLCDTDFRGAKLQGANFQRAKIKGANFEAAKLQGANFQGATVVIDKLADNLEAIHKSEALERNLNFSQAKIQGTNFQRATLFGANFTKAESGIPNWWKLVVIFCSFFVCLFAGFTSAIASTFTIHYFWFSPKQTLPHPDQKPSFLSLLIIGFFSIILNTIIRTFINNCFGAQYIDWHVGFAIILIVVALLCAGLLKDDSKADFRGILIIVLMLLITLSLTLITPMLSSFENQLAQAPEPFSIFAKHIVKGLGNTNQYRESWWIFSNWWIFPVAEEGTTNGKWLSGIFGAAIGAFFGCLFSEQAIGGDKKFNWLWKNYVRFAAFKGTDFSCATLTGAIFEWTNLQGASFSQGTRISKINWYNARCLECACFEKNYLQYPKIRYLVVRREWDEKDFSGLNLKGINLENATLNNKVLFIGTDLSNSKLHNANLQGAILKQTRLEGADLSNATLTGACIQGWSIDEKTNLKGVNCDYIFLKDEPDSRSGIKPRLPDAAAGDFQQGEFEALYTKDPSIVHLFIRNNYDRQALNTAFQQLISDKNTIIGFELVENNVLVKIKVSSTDNKSAVLNKFYQNARQHDISNEIEDFQNQSWFEFVLDLVKEIMSSNSINLNECTIGSVSNQNNVEQDQIITQYVYSSEQKQILVNTANEIQRLLGTLEQIDSKANEATKIKYVNDHMPKTLKSRVIKVLQEGGETAIEAFFDSPYIKIGKAIVKAWLN